MKKKLAGVLIAAVTACSALTQAAWAAGEFVTTEQNEVSYARQYTDGAYNLFEFSHPVDADRFGGFSCQWSGVYEIMAEVGWRLPEADTDKSYQSLRSMQMTYDVDFEADGNNFFGIHGWLQDPLTEYFIVEGWNNWRPPGGQGMQGTVTLNGRRYDVYQTVRYNQPSIEGMKTYRQYWSVRDSSAVSQNKKNRVKAEVDLYQMFQEWERNGLYMSGPLDSVGLFVWGYGGPLQDASGSFTVHSARCDPFWFVLTDRILNDEPKVTTAPVQTVPAVTTTTEPKLPADENGVFFREDFERGQGDWEKRAYEGDTTVLMPDTANYAEGQQSLHLAERSDSWNGAQLLLDPYEIEPGKAYSFQAAVMQNNAPGGQTVKMLLEYTDSSGEKNYDLIAQAECRQNAWTVLRNADYVIPADSTERKLVLHTGEGIDDFWIDSVTVAEAGKGAPIDLSGAKPASVSEQKTGDANCDGVVDVSDAVLVMRYAVADRETVISEQGLKNADTDKNGNTDSDDATNILLHIAKKIDLTK